VSGTTRPEARRRQPARKSSASARFVRALTLRCPRCGGSGILRTWLRLRDTCATCGLAFERGERSDFWIGAYVFNLVIGEVIALGVPVGWMIIAAPKVPWVRVEFVAIVLCVTLPILFFPFSRLLWLAWDLSFRPSEPGD
jgi:uncharacterized protein (DUF983 family)